MAITFSDILAQLDNDDKKARKLATQLGVEVPPVEKPKRFEVVGDIFRARFSEQGKAREYTQATFQAALTACKDELNRLNEALTWLTENKPTYLPAAPIAVVAEPVKTRKAKG